MGVEEVEAELAGASISCPELFRRFVAFCRGHESSGVSAASNSTLPWFVRAIVRRTGAKNCQVWSGLIVERHLKFRESEAVVCDVPTDSVTSFLLDRCTVDEGARVPTTALLSELLDWCKANGQTPVSADALAMSMKERGFLKKKARYPGYKTTTSCFAGIALTPSDDGVRA